MDLKKLFTEERAVSPVIGVILMVAITVILAAVIGAFVLGIGGDQEAAPQASLSFDIVGDDDLEIEHRGGDTLDLGNLNVTKDGSSSQSLGSDDFSAGETVTEESNTYVEGNRVRVVHNPTGSIISSATL